MQRDSPAAEEQGLSLSNGLHTFMPLSMVSEIFEAEGAENL
jgi:hypothetical protein